MLAFFRLLSISKGDVDNVKNKHSKKEVSFQYQFEIAPVDGKRKFFNKSGFTTKAEAEKAGVISYNEYMNTGHNFTPSTMSYSD